MRETSLSGTVDEADDPCYDLSTALPDRALDITESKTRGYKVKNILFLTDDNKASQSTEFDVIKAAVRDYGGVGAGMYFDKDSSRMYYNDSNGAYYYNKNITYNSNQEKKPDGNHLVEIVGWDDNYPRTNFNPNCLPMENGAWLAKNSWGTEYGDQGYIWISYEDTNFPMATFTIDGVEPYNPEDTVYESDYKFEGQKIGCYSGGNAYFMKEFTLDEDNQQLKAVKVFIPNSDSCVSVDCIPDLDALEPYQKSGSRAVSFKNKYTFSSKKDVLYLYNFLN